QFRRLMKAEDAIEVIRAAFTRDFSSTLRMPVRSALQLDDALLLMMPCYDAALKANGVKLVSVSAKAGVKAVYELLDPATNIPIARLEANYLTELRTAATSAVATDMLARGDVRTLGVFGTERQAAAHFAIVPRVREFTRFLVCGSGRSDRQGFCRQIRAEHGIEVEPVSPEICVADSEVICTCTT